jgi:hypothetical protein
MEDGINLNKEDKAKLNALKTELEALQLQSKNFSRTKGKITPENKEKWRELSKRLDDIRAQLKELRQKNMFAI